MRQIETSIESTIVTCVIGVFSGIALTVGSHKAGAPLPVQLVLVFLPIFLSAMISERMHGNTEINSFEYEAVAAARVRHQEIDAIAARSIHKGIINVRSYNMIARRKNQLDLDNARKKATSKL